MLTCIRARNKSVILRKVFKWAFIVASSLYLLVLVVAHAGAEYTDVRQMMQDEDHERLAKNEEIWERELDKIIPDCLSYWNFLIGAILLGASLSLIKIQAEEEEEASKVDVACAEYYREIHYTIHTPRGLYGAEAAQNPMPLKFKPYQVQKCVSIFKDYKLKAELLLCIQVLQLALIANVQYSVYGLPYLIMVMVQILYIALSHTKTDQDVRVVSQWTTYALLVILPIDLLYHYIMRMVQQSMKIDDLYEATFNGTQPSYQPTGYQGIMIATPSLVAFGLKAGLFVFECIKFKFSYDMGADYRRMKEAYVDAESSAFPSSKPHGREEEKAEDATGQAFASLRTNQ